MSELSTLSKFINEILPNQDKYYYRGQANAEDWTYRPKIARDRNNNYIDDINLIERRENETNNYLRTRLPANNYDYENISNPDQIIWRYLIIGQHYGAPTRLLDFTRNPLIACYFAICEEKNKNGEVIAIKYERDDILTFENICSEKLNTVSGPFSPPHIDKRVTVQDSLFFCFKYPNKPIEKNIKNANKKIKKFIFPKKSKEEIREDLNKLGINHLKLFPDASGLCSFINWRINSKDL